MQSFFARLENISRILRIFQAALVPPAPALPEKAAFGIATAASSHPLLPCALMEAAERVLAQLGGAPDFCFLQTEAAPSPHLRLAPQLAQTFLRGGRWGLQPVPVLVGSTSAALDATVVLTAATLPGMAVHPFHSTTTSLPDLPNDAWPKLLKPLPAGQAQAAVLLSTPDFRQSAGELAERTSNALQPRLRLLTRAAPAADSARSSEGALFLGDAVVRGPGAVGCFLRGASADLDDLMRELIRAEGSVR